MLGLISVSEDDDEDEEDNEDHCDKGNPIAASSLSSARICYQLEKSQRGRLS